MQLVESARCIPDVRHIATWPGFSTNRVAGALRSAAEQRRLQPVDIVYGLPPLVGRVY